MLHPQPITLLRGSVVVMLLGDATRLRHLKGVPRDLSLFFFTNTVPVARDILIAKQRPDLFQSPSLGLLCPSQYMRNEAMSTVRYSLGRETRWPRCSTPTAR